MVRVLDISVNRNVDVVSLVEFDALRGRLLFTDQERPLIVRGLMEPGRIMESCALSLLSAPAADFSVELCYAGDSP
ncbi:unnamed protein product [Arabis nemorensis]|uniref:Uncharacterized protein n=1 Tax=Arabis nemorensis TaxID=586526 RepID=A0A565BKN7_9BRAS|nr:unnamed protein product [Arabis nemorensis]